MPPLDAESESTGASSRASPGGEAVVATGSNQSRSDQRRDKPTDQDQVTNVVEKRPSPCPDDAALSSDETTVEDRAPLPSSSLHSQPLPQSKVQKSNIPAAATAKPVLTSEELDQEVAALTKVVQATSSKATGKVLQSCWRKFLFTENDDDHLCWVLRAGIKNAPVAVVERILRDQSVVNVLGPATSKKESIVWMILHDATYAQLLDHVPESVLDRALAERLKTAPARQIIKWLAEAERLGFREDDILDDEDESVRPNLPSTDVSENDDVDMTDVAPLHQNLALHNRDHLLAEQERNAAIQRQQQRAIGATSLTCHLCHHRFTSNSGYNYHLLKKVCMNPPPNGGYKWWCPNCARGFTTKQGMNYHVNLAKVCLEESITPATSASNQLLQEAAAASVPKPSNSTNPILPPPKPSHSNAPRPQFRGQPRTSIGASIPRPPHHTPSSSQNHSSRTNSTPPTATQTTPTFRVRLSPSELSPQRLAQLNKALANEEVRYLELCAAVDPKLDPREREARLQSLKNAHATRKSQIRKSYNVTLRMGEKDKAARNAAVATPTVRSNLEEYRAPAVSDGLPIGRATVFRSSPQAPTPSFSPINVPGNNQPHRKFSRSTAQGWSAGSDPVLPQTSGVNSNSGILQPEKPYLQHAHKRQRMEEGDSTNSTQPSLSNQNQDRTSQDAADNKINSQYPKTVEVQIAGRVPVTSPPAEWQQFLLRGNQREAPDGGSNHSSRHIALASGIQQAPEATEAPTKEQDVTVISSSEDDDIELIEPRITMSNSTGRAAPGAQQEVNSSADKSVENRTNAGHVRGVFMAKRGRH